MKGYDAPARIRTMQTCNVIARRIWLCVGIWLMSFGFATAQQQLERLNVGAIPPAIIAGVVPPPTFGSVGEVAQPSFVFGGTNAAALQFRTEAYDGTALNRLNNNFTALPDFSGGLVIVGEQVAMKVGGFIKADFISDLDPIESEDSFDTTQIPIGVADYQNTRFHAKQSRLSFDTRWQVNEDVVRAFIEADFFGGNDGGNGLLRLRHAYGTIGRFTAGQTWTTFTDPSAVPQTLDFEGAVSNVNRRQGLLRFDQPLGDGGWSWAISLEDPTIIIEVPVGIEGQGRTESPDLITRLRLQRDWGESQAAFLIRRLGFQPDGESVIAGTAWGINLTGSIHLTDDTRFYSQLTFGEGIGSYRGSPDVVAIGTNSAAILPMLGWMIGTKHIWCDRLTSNVTISELVLDDLAGQPPSNLRQTNYLAANLIYNPYDRVFCGIEYLHGLRKNQSGLQAEANRIQISCGFYLP